MDKHWRLFSIFIAVASTGVACAPRTAPSPIVQDGPPPDLIASTERLYQQYGAALSAGRRGVLANYYHYLGARIVFNGVHRRVSRDELRQRYLTSWTPPAFFTWEALTFDSLSTSQVLVTGGFRWQSAGQRDTSRFIYAALVVAQDSGMAIVFEHETLRPPD
jgi:hypothetical protein